MIPYRWIPEPWIRNFYVTSIDPGFVYVIVNGDRLKIGSSRNGFRRIRDAKTWLPDMKVVGVKPFWDFKEKERLLHIGNALSWCSREWFALGDLVLGYSILDEFAAFSDTDINRNSVDFIYWFNGSGMAELGNL